MKNLDKNFFIRKNFHQLNFTERLRDMRSKEYENPKSVPKERTGTMLPKFFKEQSRWKNIIKLKKNQITLLRSTIRKMELHNVILTTIFAIILVLSLISLVILTPLSILGLAVHATHFIWSIGIGTGFMGVGVGTILIKSMTRLIKHKNDLREARSEKNRLGSLISKGDEISLFLNYEKLLDLDVINMSAQEHLKLSQNDIWHHPLFQNHLEDLEQILQYEKNDLEIPKDIRQKIQDNFRRLQKK